MNEQKHFQEFLKCATNEQSSDDASENIDVTEWINSEIETIDELRKGTMSVQYPDGFQEDFDFLNQSSNIWVPARLHPGTAPGEFKEWLKEHKSQLDDASNKVKRRKSRLSFIGNDGDDDIQKDIPTIDSSKYDNGKKKTSNLKDYVTKHYSDDGSNLPKPGFMQAGGPRTSLKRSKLVNRRRNSKSASREKRCVSIDSATNLQTSQHDLLNNLDGNWEVSLADLSLAESNVAPNGIPSQNISTADMLKRISREVCDLSFDELGFDGTESSPDDEDDLAKYQLQNPQTAPQVYSNVSQGHSIPQLPLIQILDKNITKPEYSSRSDDVKNPEKGEIADKILRNSVKASTKGLKKNQTDSDSSINKKKGLSFLRFVKSRTSSSKDSKSTKNDVPKSDQSNTKKAAVYAPRTSSSTPSHPTAANNTQITQSFVRDVYSDNQSSRYPTLFNPFRPQPSSPSPVMYRFPIHIERAIYRLASIKLTNPRRPLQQQVLLSNMMFWYLELINPKTINIKKKKQNINGPSSGSFDKPDKNNNGSDYSNNNNSGDNKNGYSNNNRYNSSNNNNNLYNNTNGYSNNEYNNNSNSNNSNNNSYENTSKGSPINPSNNGYVQNPPNQRPRNTKESSNTDYVYNNKYNNQNNSFNYLQNSAQTNNSPPTANLRPSNNRKQEKRQVATKDSEVSSRSSQNYAYYQSSGDAPDSVSPKYSKSSKSNSPPNVNSNQTYPIRSTGGGSVVNGYHLGHSKKSEDKNKLYSKNLPNMQFRDVANNSSGRPSSNSSRYNQNQGPNSSVVHHSTNRTGNMTPANQNQSITVLQSIIQQQPRERKHTQVISDGYKNNQNNPITLTSPIMANKTSKPLSPSATPLKFVYYRQINTNTKQCPTPSLPSSGKSTSPTLNPSKQPKKSPKVSLAGYSDDRNTLII